MHTKQPELGYGWVRYVEEDVFGEDRVQVNFENASVLQTVLPDELALLDDFKDPCAAAGRTSPEAVLRRIYCGAVLGENNLTGAFLHTSTQPLPHQAFALDKILGKDRFGHLLADDVGLGKTIEAGLIITTLRRGNPAYKVLVVVPASLSLQWQDEMEEHFGLYFSIMGKDFLGKGVRGWQNQSLVIASLDALKRKEYADVLKQVGPFDLVVCDESHRLSAKRNMLSKDLEKSQNYQLFERLVADRTIEFVADASGIPRSPRLLLLSATPHQGDNLRFNYLLNLIRPDLFPLPPPKQDPGEFEQEDLKETMTRTPKSVARDWDGNPLFKGHQTRTCKIQWTELELKASRLLSDYIQSSLSSGSAGAGWQLVIQLVMHTFHKIAASSWSAIGETLKNRKEMLLNQGPSSLVDDEEDDLGLSELPWSQSDKVFFERELEMLDKMIAAISGLTVDSKWNRFHGLLREFDHSEPGCHVLIFTQYKHTQKYLADQIKSAFPRESVELVNGDIPLDERRQARHRFEDNSRFMISTEAGGEGVNLQKASHIMFNYDLPWNPMRLQQRIGRLDRYGQKRVVSVINLLVPDSWDAVISTRILERLEVIQKALDHVTDGLENYKDMLLGEIADAISPEELFAEHMKTGKMPDDQQIDEWVNEALKSKDRWKQLFSAGLGLASQEQMPAKCALGADEFRRAYAYALGVYGIKLQETRTHDHKFVPDVYHYTLPPAFRDPILRPTREYYVVFDRDRFNAVRDDKLGQAKGQDIKPSLAGFSESVTDWLFQAAFHGKKDESVTGIKLPDDCDLQSGWLLAYALRWQFPVRRLLAPDSMCSVWVPDSGDAVVLDARSVCHQLESLEKGTACAIPPTGIPVDKAKPLVQAHLKHIVTTRSDSARTIADMFLHAAVYLQRHETILP